MRRFREGTRSEDPRLLLGLDAADDAAVYEIAPGKAIVLTTDFFTPIVDDPYEWGAIAAANSFSDVYAMGGKPLLSLNLVGWPKDLDADLLARLLEGGADKAAEAGAAIVGGHTIDDKEPKYGMAVVGTADPNQIIKTGGAAPGMHLYLTKPLSMGIVSTAIKKQSSPRDLIEAAVATMSALNDRAADAMLEAGAAAATDVTGFGLLGHLHEMCAASECGAEIQAGAPEILDGVLELAAAGFVPGGTRRNQEHYKQFVEFKEVGPELEIVLFDAQTSGGLLIAVDEAASPALKASFEARGVDAKMIGVMTDGPSGSIMVKGSS